MRNLLFLFLACLFAPLALADYQLDSQHSELHFVSVKKTDVAEVHHFKALQGGISGDGTVRLVIDLESVATGIEVRDQRVKELLFEVSRFSEAVFHTRIDPKEVASLAIGERKKLAIDGKLELHGQTQSIKTTLDVVRLSDQRLFASTSAPLVLSANAFDMGGGLQHLAAIAALSSISDAVMVTLTLEFVASNTPAKPTMGAAVKQ